MKLRGVVHALILMTSLEATAADVSPDNKLFTDEYTAHMLKTLFEGIGHRPTSYLKRFSFIDIESLLEEFPEIATQFANLSEREREELAAVIDEFNVAFAETIFSMNGDE